MLVIISKQGSLRSKAPLPSGRDSFWMDMRRPQNGSQTTVPVHRYVFAYEDLQKLSSNKRSTYTIRNMESIGPTTGKVLLQVFFLKKSRLMEEEQELF